MDVMVAKKQTDWYSWLRRTGLDPKVVYEYSLLFSQNELDEGDLTHFDHPFLQSMGITIAKHRLQILKLAKTDTNKAALILRPISRFVSAALGKTRRRFAEMVTKKKNKNKNKKEDVEEEGKKRGGSALVVLQRPTKEALMLQRSKSLELLGSQKRLLVTSASMKIAAAYGHRHSCREPRGNNNVDVFGCSRRGHAEDDDLGGKSEEEEMCWDFMFQDMKPN